MERMNQQFTKWQELAEELAQLQEAGLRIHSLVAIPPGGSPEERLATLLRIRDSWNVPQAGTIDPVAHAAERLRENLRHEADAIGVATANFLAAVDWEIIRLLKETDSDEVILTESCPVTALRYYRGSEDGLLVVMADLSLLPPEHRLRSLLPMEQCYLLDNGHAGIVLGIAVGTTPIVEPHRPRCRPFYFLSDAKRLTAAWVGSQKSERQRVEQEAAAKETALKQHKWLKEQERRLKGELV
jgi:hypothetical protein